MRIAVACDHAGFPLKDEVMRVITDTGNQPLNLGTDNTDPVDYPDYATKLAQAILDGKAERGVLICGSGIGACIAANKIPGIYAGLCHDVYSAGQSVEHDDMNVLCLGARIIGPALVPELVRAFLNARFSTDERHQRRVGKIRQLERAHQLQERKMNATLKLLEAGQSVWYDNIQRSLLKNGELAGMVQRGEIRGVTSNPTIFMNAITKSQDYDQSLLPLVSSGMSAEEIFFSLAIEDIQAATDLFLPLYQQTKGGDGYVSLEVSPYLANETEKTLAQAKELWKRVNRPNLMIKIPATKAGIPAIAEAIAAGLNVNVTLIFSLVRYAEVMDAYMKGLEKRVAQGLAIDSIASVASFFVSRVDTKIDPHLQEIIGLGGAPALQAAGLLGKTAIANARLAYADFKQTFGTERWQKLNAKGARVQRPLWASTSTKNPSYRDVVYVEELIGPDTVNTIPPQTLTAFLDHGQVRASLEENLPAARQALADLEKLGISMEQVTLQLELEGVSSFSNAFSVLLKAINSRR